MDSRPAGDDALDEPDGQRTNDRLQPSSGDTTLTAKQLASRGLTFDDAQEIKAQVKEVAQIGPVLEDWLQVRIGNYLLTLARDQRIDPGLSGDLQALPRTRAVSCRGRRRPDEVPG